MRVVIKEWPNRTASIMTDIGQLVWTFSSAEMARAACREWFRTSAGDGVCCEIVAEQMLNDGYTDV